MTASKAAAVLGLSPWQSPYSLWREMRGDVPLEDISGRPAVIRGHLLEAACLEWWLSQHEPEGWIENTRQPWMTVDGLDWAAATPDMLASRRVDGPETLIVEAKTAARTDGWGQPGTDEIPPAYLVQCYWQLAMVPRAKEVRVAVLGPWLEFAEYVVKRNDEDIADLVDICHEFYLSLSADEPPELGDSLSTWKTLKALHPDIEAGEAVTVPRRLGQRWHAAKRAVKTAEARQRRYANQLLDRMGRAQYAITPDGSRVARRQPSRAGVSLVAVERKQP
jgi:putative phage-type endonuclease